MYEKSVFWILTLFFSFLFVSVPNFSESSPQNPLTKAIQLFDQEKFEEAELLFKELIDKKPDDFMINYFYGACRTNNGHYSQQELNYLLKASREVNPLDIDYYLGVQHHAANNFEKALEHYNRFLLISSAAEQRKLGISEKTDACKNKVNPFKTTEPETSTSVTEFFESIDTVTHVPVSDKVDMVSQIPISDQFEQDTSKLEIVDKKEIFDFNEIKIDTLVAADSLTTKQDTTIEQVQKILVHPASDTITVETPSLIKNTLKQLPEKFIVNSNIIYEFEHCFQTNEGKKFYNEGIAKQTELEKVILRADILREKYKNSNIKIEKDSIGQIILQLETLTYELKKVSEDLLLKAKNAENTFWQNASNEQLNRFISENDSISKSWFSDKEVEINQENMNEIIIPDILIDETPAAPETVNTTETDLVYRIQIGAYRRNVPPSAKQLHEKLSLIRKIENYTDENGVVVYITGLLSKYKDAEVMLKQVQQEGVKDALIAPYLKGKRITLKKAKEIEGIE